jgi:3-oxoacyl-[acyl-carrier protein] reductase
MKERKYGRILNIGSIWVEQTKKNRSAYSASKAALDALSRSITAEYAQYNILANTLSPGFIGTQLTYKNNTPEDLKQIVSNVPVGRLGTPAEIATLAYFLTVDNTYISGQNIIIDGGFSCTR